MKNHESIIHMGYHIIKKKYIYLTLPQWSEIETPAMDTSIGTPIKSICKRIRT